ncbi:MAG: hypothetical protein ABIH83_00670 [Candidatus Micrarchaeota archaeon]
MQKLNFSIIFSALILVLLSIPSISAIYCNNGETKCIDDTHLASCRFNEWSPAYTMPCPLGCENDACIQNLEVCDQGLRQCDGQDILYCDDDGEIKIARTCEEGTTCLQFGWDATCFQSSGETSCAPTTNYFNKFTMVCIDDCESTFGSGPWVCDFQFCNCIHIDDFRCSGGAVYADGTCGADDCAQAYNDDSYYCNPDTCRCVKGQPEEPESGKFCSEEQRYLNGTCGTDNCAQYYANDSYYCDAENCKCLSEEPGGVFYPVDDECDGLEDGMHHGAGIQTYNETNDIWQTRQCTTYWEFYCLDGMLVEDNGIISSCTSWNGQADAQDFCEKIETEVETSPAGAIVGECMVIIPSFNIFGFITPALYLDNCAPGSTCDYSSGYCKLTSSIVSTSFYCSGTCGIEYYSCNAAGDECVCMP